MSVSATFSAFRRGIKKKVRTPPHVPATYNLPSRQTVQLAPGADHLPGVFGPIREIS